MSLAWCVILGLAVTPAATRPWCFNRTKYYALELSVEERVCRLAGDQPVGLSGRSEPLTPSWRQDPSTAAQVAGMFPGLFLNTTEARKLNSVLKKGLPLPEPDVFGRRLPPGHDGGLHCPTFRKLLRAPDKIANIYQQRRDIVHFNSEGVYQYVHKGTCGSKGKKKGCRNGGCFQETSIVYLMVWTDDPAWPTKFEPFELESYCSCKGITVP